MVPFVACQIAQILWNGYFSEVNLIFELYAYLLSIVCIELKASLSLVIQKFVTR